MHNRIICLASRLNICYCKQVTALGSQFIENGEVPVKQWKRNLAVLLACGLLAGCAAPPAPRPIPAPAESSAAEPPEAAESDLSDTSMKQFMEEINQAHQAIQKPVIKFANYLHEASSDDLNLFEYQQERDFDSELPMTMEEVREDADILFRALQTAYGPYYHFGGDEAFGAAKAALLEDCAKETPLTAGYFAEAIPRHLSFMGDGHFNVNGQRVSQPYLGYAYTQVPFIKTVEGYMALNEKNIVASVEGWELDELFRRSIMQDGSVVWYPVVMTESQGDLEWKPDDITVHFTDGSQRTLSADPWESWYEESERTVDLQYNQGVPVLFVRNMGFDEAIDDELGRRFLEYAAELKDEPALIIDLRSNGGGNSILPLKWFQEYAGQFVPTNYQGIAYWTEQDMREYCADRSNPYYTSWESMTGLAAQIPISDAYMKCFDQPDAFIPNDRLLILLTGKNTASAAETFTDVAHNLENTLVIGQNTYGMLTSNAYTVIYLPNSGASVGLGSDLNFFPEGDFEEFKGYQPDLWTNGDAEEAAVQFVKRWNQREEAHD